jgi:hypothetical protein
MLNQRLFPCCFLLCCLFLSSCKETLDRSAFINWVHDYRNGLHVKKIVSEFVFDLQYKPSQYIALMSTTPSVSADPVLEYYTLNISLKDPSVDFINYNVNDSDAKQKKVYYFSYLFQDDIFLEEAGGRMPCVLFHFEQSDLKKSRTFVLGFEKSKSALDGSGDETRLVIDSPYFTSLPIKIKISKASIPELKI